MTQKIVCLDSMVCVWGIKKVATDGQEHMIKRTEALFDLLEKEDVRVIIPAPVVTEILCPIPKDQRASILNLISEKFIVAPLDIVSAIKAGEVWHENENDWKKIYDERGEDGVRNRFKMDTLIIGIAIAKNVDCLYTFDNRLTKIGSKYLTVKEPPLVGSQGSLFQT